MKYPISLCCLLTAVVGVGTAAAVPIINEVMSSNETAHADEDGEFPDWVELYNPDGAAYSLEGHFLTDDEDNLERWAFPDVEIPANGYLVVFASGKDRRDAEGELHTNFGISGRGEYVALVAEDGQSLVSSVVVPPLEDDESYIAVESVGSRTYEMSNEPTPGAENADNVVLFSLTGQAFTDTLTLELSSPAGGAIDYTEDGRKPTLFNKKTYNGPITIDKTVMINASTGGGPSRTEVFIKVSPELADRDSEIPLVIVDTFGNSVASKEASMTNMAIGFQDVEASGRANLIGPLETNSRGGVRKRGQSSGGFAKFPMRMELWNDQQDADDNKEGRDRTLAPLGMPANSDFILNARFTFDKALIRNTWIMELSNTMDRYATRTRHVELYLNDDGTEVGEEDYFGVYTFMETIKRGGDRVDVPAMSETDTEAPGITGGYIFKKDKSDQGIWQFTAGGTAVQMVYPTEEDRPERGHQEDYLKDVLNEFNGVLDNPDPVEGYPAYIDVESWIDHHWLNVIPLNVDAMRISGYFFKERDSEEGTGKIHAGPIWDYDRSAGSTDGRTTDAERWRGRGGDNGTHFFRSALGEPRWWQELFKEKEFTQAWVDRWRELRDEELVTTEYDDTPLPAFSIEHISRIIDHQGATIGEAGDRNFDKWKGAPAGGHAGAVEHLKDWMTTRMEWIESEMVTTPTYTPSESVHDGTVSVTMEAPPSSIFNPLQVYYTTDGSDPRAVGGEPSATATKYDGAFDVTESTTIYARKWDPTHKTSEDGPTLEWSAIGKIRYFVGEEPASSENLVVSEIMYNPADPTAAEEADGFDDKDDFEFIELLNIGSKQVSLYGVRLRGAADFDFADDASLAPGERLVVVANADAFAKRYGTPILPAGQYTGGLTNSGARIFLRAHDRSTIHEFNYSDEEPWPQDADGEGKALVLAGAANNPDPSLPGSWIAGSKENGTPGTDESGGPVDPEPGEGFTDWLAEQFSEAERADPDIAGPAADADGDGLPTLAEYLLGGDPLSAEPERVPAVFVDEGFLQVIFTRTAGLTDVESTLQVSTDLVSWSAAEGVEEISVTDNGDGKEVVVLRHTKALSEDGARYARLQVNTK